MTMNDSTISARVDNGAVSMSRSSSTDIDQRESIGELIGAATRDMSELLRKEVELAKVELKEEAAAAGKAGALLGAGGVLGFQALLLFFFAVAWGLAELIPAWVGFLIVAIVVGVIATVVGLMGKEKLQDLTPPIPNTVETLQEDAQWAKQQLS